MSFVDVRAVIAEKRIDAAEEWREHGRTDPAYEEHLQAVQERYERDIGWTHD